MPPRKKKKFESILIGNLGLEDEAYRKAQLRMAEVAVKKGLDANDLGVVEIIQMLQPREVYAAIRPISLPGK
jgi:hypothetical protein